jgi:hypothetical protein
LLFSGGFHQDEQLAVPLFAFEAEVQDFGMISVSRVAAVIGLLTVVLTLEVRAVSVWNNAAGGLYSNPANWTGGVPAAGGAVNYNVNGTYTVNVDGAANHGVTQFAASNANVTLNITGPSYVIPSTVKIGSSGTNNVSVSGSSFNPMNVEIAPVAGIGKVGSLTLSGPMHSSIVAVGGQIAVSSNGIVSETRGGTGTLTLNPGADLTTNYLIANNEGPGSQIVFNGGTLTLQGEGRFNGFGPVFTQIGDGTHAATLNLLNGSKIGIYDFEYQTLTVPNNATLNFNSPNGALLVGNLVRASGGATPGVFNWTAGYFIINSAGLDITPAGLLGGTLDLTPARSLDVRGNVTVTNGSSVTLSGGLLAADTLMVNPGGTVDFASGTIAINTGGLEIGPNGITHAGGITLTDPGKDVIQAANGELSIASGQSLTINGGGLFLKTLSNHGLLTYTSGLFNMAGPLSIGPTGQLNNSPNLTLAPNMTLDDYSGDVTIEPTQTVTFNGGSLTAANLINNGTLNYNSGNILITQGDITIGPTGQIRNQPNLELQGSFQTVNGSVRIQETQTVNLNGTLIFAPNVVVDGTINFASGNISGETMSVGGANGTGQLVMTAGTGANVGMTNLYRGNLLVNGGVINCSNIAPPPSYTHDSSMTVNGGAVYASNMLVGAAPGHVDTVTVNGGTFQADKLIAKNGAASVLIFNGGTINVGHAEVDGPSALVVGNGSTKAQLYLYGGGEGTYSFAQGVTISTSGELGGDGTLTGNVTNNGKFSPVQASFLPFTIDGSLVTTGTLALDITTVDFYDKLVVTGNFNAGGVIAITTSYYVDLGVGATFDLMDFASLTDSSYTIDLKNAVLPNGRRWDISQFATDGTIRVVAGYTGDFNQDGKVDGADYAVWRKGLRAVYTSDDLSTWRAQFGLSAGSGNGTSLDQMPSIPEPASVLLLAVGSMATGLRRRKFGRRLAR